MGRFLQNYNWNKDSVQALKKITTTFLDKETQREAGVRPHTIEELSSLITAPQLR